MIRQRLSQIVALAGLAALVTACGSVKQLRPAEGMSEVPTVAAATKRETPQELMAPSTQAQPDRQADLLDRSMVRENDPFDLPPGPDNGRAGQ